MSQVADSPLDAAREAAGRQDWTAAFGLLSVAEGNGNLGADELVMLAEAATATGHYREGTKARERAYARYLKSGQKLRAARVAIDLGNDYVVLGQFSVTDGWQRSAERLLKDEPEGPEHGWLAWVHAQYALLFHRDLDTALRFAEEMVSIGERLGDLDIQMLALSLKARVLVTLGQVDEGTQLLDEAMAIALTGELEPRAAEYIYCNGLGACQELSDFRRATEWTEAADLTNSRQQFLSGSGHCRAHRAGILRSLGEWTEAEEEARHGCEELEGGNLLHIGWALYELGEIRLLKGDLAAAEETFQRANELGRTPQPGMALLRLAQGKVDVALSSIAHALSDDLWDRQARANLLFAQVEIAIAAGQLDVARSASEQQVALADAFRTTALEAGVAYVDGALALAESDLLAATASLRRASRLWQEVGVPYEVARSRVLLATASIADGDMDTAEMELRAAQSTFDRLGAAPDERRARGLLASIIGTSDAGETPATARIERIFMFTDIVKSTTLLDAIGDEAWNALLHWHDETLRAIFAEHEGEEVHYTGDGFFVACKDAWHALECAVDIQRALAEHRRKHGFAPQVRIGLHAGTATRTSLSYHGLEVHAAARIGAMAEGGEILMSRATLPNVESRFAVGSPRTVTLRGVSQPVEIVSIAWR